MAAMESGEKERISSKNYSTSIDSSTRNLPLPIGINTSHDDRGVAKSLKCKKMVDGLLVVW
jgi:hypothetical protein